MIKKCLRLILLILIVVFWFSILPGYGSASPATPVKNLVLRYGHVGPFDQVMHKASVVFKKYVDEQTKGAIEIQIFPMSQLGGERTIFDSILTGTVDMGAIGAPIQSTVIKEFNVFCLPFVAINEDVLWDIARSKEFRDRFFPIIRAKGIEPIGFCNITQRGLLNKRRRIIKVADMKGLNIRVMEGSIYTDMYNAMGSFPRTMPFPEVYTGLQQGVIEAIDSGIDMAARMKFVEVAKFYTKLNQTIQIQVLIVAKASWDKLTNDQRHIFSKANEAMELFSQEEFKKDYLDTVKYVKDRYGVEFIEELTPEDRETFRKAVEPVITKYRKAIGEEFCDSYIDLIHKYEKKYKK